MKGMPISFQIEEGSLANFSFNFSNKRKLGLLEPCSVLDSRRSPSPPTSTSTLGGGGGGSSDSAGVAAISDNGRNKWQPAGDAAAEKEEWASELQPIPPSTLGCGGAGAGIDEWEAVLSETSPTQEQTFLRWIMGDVEDASKQQQLPPPPLDFEHFGPLLDPGFGPFVSSSAPPPPQPPPNSLPLFFQEADDEKPLHFINHNQLHPPQNASFFMPSLPPAAPTGGPYGIQQRPLMLPVKPKDEAAASAAAIAQQQQALVDQLLKAAELIEAGNPFSAREILARLNHQLPPSPLGLKPLLRSAFIFKQALSLLAGSPRSFSAAPLSNPSDVVLKLSSYKAFSEVSPLIHFANFTCAQTLLEELAGYDRIHIVDFDIGVGSQWSSFMQELAHRRAQMAPLLKITAFVSPSAFHPLELHLTRDNLSQFAAELGIPFEFAFVSIESFNPSELLAVSANEAIAVNLSIGSHYVHSFPTLLRLVKQLQPKIVVSVDQMCDRGDLPWSHHFLRSFQACMVLLDSIDAAGTNADVANKIERFLVQPRVENAVLGRHRAAEKMPPWRALFASVGFVPYQFSNFTETQAECLLKRVQVRGFHVEKRQASLFLYWQRGELGSVSAWKC